MITGGRLQLLHTSNTKPSSFNRDGLASQSRIATMKPGSWNNLPFKAHPVPLIWRATATGLGASMWFFLFYRAKQDGPVLLGWKHPWDH